MTSIRIGILSIAILLLISKLSGQSLELMPGSERVFVDAQWLRTFDEQRKWSLFSRSRATVDYDEKTDLFTGAYINYTTKSGLGGSVVGRISTRSAGGDVGIHFFRAKESFLIYALASVAIDSEFAYSWFSIFRYMPEVSSQWKIYSSLELFFNFNMEGHVASVQRIRAGMDRNGYQFGLAINLGGIGNDYGTTDTNPGIFLRKQF